MYSTPVVTHLLCHDYSFIKQQVKPKTVELGPRSCNLEVKSGVFRQLSYVTESLER